MALPRNLDKDKLAEAALGLLSLTLHGSPLTPRVWKGMDWDLLALLHERGWIADPRSKARSVALTPEGNALADDVLISHFGRPLKSPRRPVDIDVLAERVLECRAAFDGALSGPRDAAFEALEALWQAVCEYTDALGDAEVIHRAIAWEFSGLREYLESTVPSVPGEFLSRAERMEYLLLSGRDPYFEGSEPPGL